MSDFTLVFYRKENGECPVSDFVASLNKEMRYKIMQKLDFLELYGNHPKGDFTKPVRDGIFEVRAQNKTDITRLLFFYDKNKQIVLTNGFVKKSQKTPTNELETAKKYRTDYLTRSMSEDKGVSNEMRKELKKEYVTSGPRWRPELDSILADATKRSDSALRGHGKHKDDYGLGF